MVVEKAWEGIKHAVSASYAGIISSVGAAWDLCVCHRKKIYVALFAIVSWKWILVFL